MTAAFKAKLKAGEPVIVVNADHPNPGLVEYLGRLPIDAVFLDCEQGSADVETIENMARAARLMKLTSIVRLFSGEDWVIERYMGRGPDGIVVPRLETAEQAARVVAGVRYCYPKTHDEKLVIVQIETRQAFEDLDAFLQVEGIDVYFIGPVDLAKSLGFGGDFRHPEMQRILNEAIAAIRSRGKAAGTLVNFDDVSAYVERGAQFLYCHVNDFLREGSKSFAGLVKGT
jgi:4-hydroxy-2-oxoheptanedioate aldolase